MIKVFCNYKTKKLHSIRVFGHANFSKFGNDIVCSSVSSIIFGSFSFFKTFYSNLIFCEKKDNEISFYLEKESEKAQDFLSMMVHQLENISQFYPLYLEVEKKDITDFQ